MSMNPLRRRSSNADGKPDPRTERAADRTAVQDRDLDQPSPTLDRTTVIARERATFGGVKLGSAFFGWLTALGTAVLLTALVAAAATAVRVASGNVPTSPGSVVAGSGLRADIAIIAILFIAYYCGGYVAGRMARFNGARQGVVVWLIAVVAALLISAVSVAVGGQWDPLATLNGFPRFTSGSPAVTAGGVVTTLIALAAALVGAVLGGLAGMRFHRRVDRAGLGR